MEFDPLDSTKSELVLEPDTPAQVDESSVQSSPQEPDDLEISTPKSVLEQSVPEEVDHEPATASVNEASEPTGLQLIKPQTPSAQEIEAYQRAKYDFQESDVRQQQLMDFLFAYGVTPDSDDFVLASEAWLRKAFPTATKFQISQTAQTFQRSNREAWKKQGNNREQFQSYSAIRLSAKFRIPSDPAQSDHDQAPWKKMDLIDFLLGQDLTPFSYDYRSACEAWMRNALQELSNSQISSVAKSFVYQTRNMWKTSKSCRKHFWTKFAQNLSREIPIPANKSQAAAQQLKNAIHLESNGKILYLNSYSLSGYADTKLVSSDGYTIYLNRAVLAATSPMLRNILGDFHNSDEICIITEMPKDELKMFRQFVTEGTVDVMGSNRTHGRYMDRKLQDGLQVLGINLNLLKLQTVKKENDSRVFDRPVLNPMCNGDIMKVVSESELLSKGENHVRSEAIKHCIFNSYCLDLKTLVRRISCHYLKFHDVTLVQNVAQDTIGQPEPKDAHIINTAKSTRIKRTNFSDLPEHVDSGKPSSTKSKPNKRKQTLEPLKDADESPVKIPKVLDGVIPLPLDENGQKTQAQTLFEEMMKGQETAIDIDEDEDNKKEEFAHSCIACGKSFQTLYHLEEHTYFAGKYHNNKCPRCPGIEFNSWTEHKLHQTLEHNGVFFSRCKYCPEVFEENKLRLKHQREDHGRGKKKVQCCDCGKFLFEKLLKAHQERHKNTEEKSQSKSQPVQCKHCSKWVDNNMKLSNHVSAVHKKFCCELCGMTVSEKHKRIHVLQYHTAEEKKPFLCSVCVPVKGFINQHFLDDHMNIHKGIKPYSCDLCPNVAYANKANLHAHIRATHQGRKRKTKSK